MNMKPEFLEAHRASMRRHPYQWTGRSRDTCAYTQGSSVWCSLGEADPIHQPLPPPPPPPKQISVVYITHFDYDSEDVIEVLHQIFVGDEARDRAESFMRHMSRSDFPPGDGWEWHVHSNDAANEAYGAEMARKLLGVEEDE